MLGNRNANRKEVMERFESGTGWRDTDRREKRPVGTVVRK